MVFVIVLWKEIEKDFLLLFVDVCRDISIIWQVGLEVEFASNFIQMIGPRTSTNNPIGTQLDSVSSKLNAMNPTTNLAVCF